ncbi:AAA family ATPase [Mucilaginibacter glaciei]|uniref:AAA family ATPase n=1 Tax=Mucilaginibacter glaciei TaxID=2772109 RepID=A0A926NRF2_9SPHI|nr:AAA family ATPase [Mucilaginibacter glaciei]MBD1393350.1 AAA family ATPase [Mucilaginibacter glaciei]
MDGEFYKGVTFYRPDIINDIRVEVQKSNTRLKKHGLSPVIFTEKDKTQLFVLRKARDWMAREHNNPQPRKLLGDLWTEGELCILFADTNLGKSILAVQIGNSLTTDQSVGPFANQLPALTPVLYIDFELGAKQFQSRYTDNLHGNFAFGESFHRAEFNPFANNPALFDNYNDQLIASLETAINKSKAKVLIIDNLTYMRNGTERAKDALPLMKQLKALKTKHKLSVLCLAHTPKRNNAKPITVNDLQGSKMIINFCDSAFAIGQSFTTPGGRYIKQIKQRSNSQVYGSDNVCLCHIVKEMNDLRFEFDGFAHEADHLQQPRDRNQLKQQAIELQQQGHSYRQISQQLNIGLATVNRFLA